MYADVFRPTMAIVEDAVTSVVSEAELFLAPNMNLLKRATNLHRSKIRPNEPRDIQFEVIFKLYYKTIAK
jgi:hypothetical protein